MDITVDDILCIAKDGLWLVRKDDLRLRAGLAYDLEKTGKHVEVMVYGDGAFKDPQGKIWELSLYKHHRRPFVPGSACEVAQRAD